MSARELNSFVQKFYQLWNAGHNAHLDVDCHDGAAWVGLRVQLGHPPSPHHDVYPPYHYRKSFSPSYQRRRERRAAARENREYAEEASNQNEKNENAEEASTKDNETKENGEKSNECENNVLEITEAEEVSQERDDIIKNTENIGDEIEKEHEDDDKESCVVTTITQEIPVTIPEEIPVYCTALIENCPDCELTEDYYQSIRRFLVSEEHLVKNISSAELQFISSRLFRSNLYTHTVSIVIYVKTARLWENPASYIRKHLGLTNYWTRSNGTVVKLSRIHQK